MENWYEDNDIFRDFNEEKTQRWLENNFTKEEAKKWLEILSEKYSKCSISHFVSWIKINSNNSIMNNQQLEQEIKKLQQEMEELKKSQHTSEGAWHKNLARVVFYGAVASSITSIANLLLTIIKLLKK